MVKFYEEQSLGFYGTDGIQLTFYPRWYDRTSDTERHATSAARIVRSVSLLSTVLGRSNHIDVDPVNLNDLISQVTYDQLNDFMCPHCDQVSK